MDIEKSILMHFEEHDLDEIRQLQQGGADALAACFSRYRDRLERMIRFRMDKRLLGRADVGDILQESYIEISKRGEQYLEHPEVSPFVWMRMLTSQVLINVHRRHFSVKKRDVQQEVSPRFGGNHNSTSICLAEHLVGNLTSPSQAAIRDELLEKLRAALETLEDLDREVLALRHFEELTNNEVAAVLNLGKSAASNRYIRALKRLRIVLAELGEFGGPGR